MVFDRIALHHTMTHNARTALHPGDSTLSPVAFPLPQTEGMPLGTPGGVERPFTPAPVATPLAHVVTNAASPPVLAVECVLLLATGEGGAAWSWAGVLLALSIVAPMGVLVWMLKCGRVGDLDIRRRDQRTIPMLITIAGGASAWAALALGDAPAILQRYAGASVIQAILLLAVTFRWKISVHGGAAGLVFSIFSLQAGQIWPLLIGLPLLGWSRLHLKHHTPAQVVSGALLGAAVFLIFFVS